MRLLRQVTPLILSALLLSGALADSTLEQLRDRPSAESTTRLLPRPSRSTGAHCWPDRVCEPLASSEDTEPRRGGGFLAILRPDLGWDLSLGEPKPGAIGRPAGAPFFLQRWGHPSIPRAPPALG